MSISKKFAALFSGLGLIAGTAGAIALQTHAASTTTDTAQNSIQQQKFEKTHTPPAASGTVTAVSGNTVTVTDAKTGTSYAVDASSATIEKMTAGPSGQTDGTRPSPTTIAVSDIKVGDSIMVEGTVSGNTITAAKIFDGVMRGPGRHGMRGAMGTVTAINGNTITLTGTEGTTTTVDATGASIKVVTDGSLANIKVGDKIMAQGTVSGNTVTATRITDGEFGPHNGQ